MSDKPDWFAQTGEDMSSEEIEVWRACAQADAVEQGCTFFQYSIDPDKNPPSRLFEGWKEPQMPSPSPRFHYSPPKER